VQIQLPIQTPSIVTKASDNIITKCITDEESNFLKHKTFRVGVDSKLHEIFNLFSHEELYFIK
jgi:hypothetical protein